MTSLPHRPAIHGLVPALIVLLSGITAALHVGKIAPALPVLTRELGLTLVEAGFLISLVHISGMTIGVLLGLVIGGWGLKRSLVGGLVLCGLASVIGGWAQGATLLLVLRALEGLGFLLIALAGPGLIRNLVPPLRMPFMLGLWSTYMPVGSALAILTGPLLINVLGWQSWWWCLAAVSLVVAAWASRALPDERRQNPNGRAAPPADRSSWQERLWLTLRSPGPWLVGIVFALYAGQWQAIIGFLPTIYEDAGITGGLAGLLTALVATVNIGGNVSSGRLLQRGMAPRTVLVIGFLGMGLSTIPAFADLGAFSAPAWLRYVGVLIFSGVGGVIPGTLFNLAVRFAPSEKTIPTTVGWMQQWSSFGQVATPPLVGWIAALVGGWQLTWTVTVLCSLAGLVFAGVIGRQLQRQPSH